MVVTKSKVSPSPKKDGKGSITAFFSTPTKKEVKKEVKEEVKQKEEQDKKEEKKEGMLLFDNN
jgi:hypothetical protein